jgi:hypothetical protein
MAGVVGGAAIVGPAVNGRNWANLLVLATGPIDDGGGDQRTMYCWQLISYRVGIECCKRREVLCVDSLFARHGLFFSLYLAPPYLLALLIAKSTGPTLMER